jgi:Tol biopolymer transport system component
VAEDNDGDERCQLFRVDLARPGDLLPLTEPSPPYFLRGGQLHPNGRWLIYGANYDAEAGHEIEPTWVYRHDVVSEERVALARPARSGWVTPDLNPPGTHILYSRNEADPAGQQVWLVDIEGRDDREVINVGAARKVSASWLPDGTRAIVLAETDTHRRVGL